jgi:Pregnancy-associated plasma protein-A/Secretion system C-terminal sorting domain/Fibronectin type III domain/Bacterial pre-peptidase C-terminal domain
MKQIFILLVTVLALQDSMLAQRNCGTSEYQMMLEQQDPSIINRREEIEQFTRDYLINNPQGERALVTIPVVVHVVYNTAAENISDAQIQSQITVLNQDFRKLNADVANTPSAFLGLAGDSNIEFCLATVDPNGNATNGILRVPTTATSFGTNNTVKSTTTGGSNPWNASKYLNLWVCDISGSILGYAQFPGGSASTDGVVVDYLYFGTIGTATAPFNKGRTATHEVGHWLNLRHIWGDDGTGCTGSDSVTDTPNSGGPNYGCPAFPTVTCSNGPNGDMFMNYMDYTDDACMYMFSNGQVSRMQALFATGGARAALVTSNGCGVATPVLCGNITGLAAGSITQTGATISWSAVTGATGYVLQYKLATSTTWTSVNVATTSFDITGLTAGTAYNVQVQSVCSAGNGNFSAINFTTTATTTSCTDTYESNNTTGTAKTITVNTNITARIGSSTDKDWFKFSNTSSARNIRIDLSNLPADYDVRLYNPSGTQVAISQNSGTTAEVITYNTTTTGTWRVQVYGYNGAFNASLCYTLRASISASAFREGEETPAAELNTTASESDVVIANVFPNPTNGKLNVILEAAEAQNTQLRICDITGRTALQHNATCVSGSNTIILDMETLPNGYYLLVIDNGTASSTMRVVKN